MPFDVSRMQSEVDAARMDAWLFYGFHDVDPIAIEILDLPRDGFFSRRWFYMVPASGEPVKLVSRVEKEVLDSLPGERLEYSGWRELQERLGALLKAGSTVAMQYSPDSSIPHVSRVDGGILDLVRKFGARVVTSADLVQKFQAVWSPTQVEMHRASALKLHRIVEQTFAWVAESFAQGSVDEYSIQQEMLLLFEEHQLFLSHPPIVAFNENASNPHFSPSREKSKAGKRGDILLIDLWGKERQPGSVYADITWMGVLDSSPSSRHREIFELDACARDAGVAFLERRWREDQKVHGWEVDDVVRKVIADAKLGQYFVHRTGHSIGEDVHGNGVNLDNLETRDEREIIPGVCFSVEPGIYLPEFGVRTEINVFIDPDQGPIVTTQPVQRELVCLLQG